MWRMVDNVQGQLRRIIFQDTEVPQIVRLSQYATANDGMRWIFDAIVPNDSVEVYPRCFRSGRWQIIVWQSCAAVYECED